MITMQQKRDALDAIAATNDGKLTPELVVDAARHKGHILHELFEWDVVTAARSHWREVAGDIIREVRFEWIVENRTISTPAYAHDPGAPKHAPSMIALTTVQQRSSKARAIIHAELEQRIIPAISRAQSMADCLGLRREFDALLSNAVALRTRIERTEEKRKSNVGGVKPSDVAARAAARRDAGRAKPRHA